MALLFCLSLTPAATATPDAQLGPATKKLRKAIKALA